MNKGWEPSTSMLVHLQLNKVAAEAGANRGRLDSQRIAARAKAPLALA